MKYNVEDRRVVPPRDDNYLMAQAVQNCVSLKKDVIASPQLLAASIRKKPWPVIAKEPKRLRQSSD